MYKYYKYGNDRTIYHKFEENDPVIAIPPSDFIEISAKEFYSVAFDKKVKERMCNDIINLNKMLVEAELYRPNNNARELVQHLETHIVQWKKWFDKQCSILLSTESFLAFWTSNTMSLDTLAGVPDNVKVEEYETWLGQRMDEMTTLRGEMQAITQAISPYVINAPITEQFVDKYLQDKDIRK